MAAKVADILEASTMAEDKYTTLKQQLLERFQLSEQEHAHRLLEFRGLGDRKPSELMEKILSLLQDEPFSFIVKEIYLQQLPPVVQAQLANTDFKTNPWVAATLADKLWFATCQHAVPVAAGHIQASTDSSAETLEINQVRRTSQRCTTQQHTHHTGTDMCYYHRTFGKDAINVVQCAATREMSRPVTSDQLSGRLVPTIRNR